MTTFTRRALLAALPLLVVALAGCELRADVGIDVHADGGGTLGVTLAADQELQQAAQRAGAEPLSLLAEAARQLEGWRVERDRDTPGAPVTLSAGFADPQELSTLSRELANALAAPELRPIEPWQLEVDQRTVELTGAVSLEVTSEVAALGVSPRRATRILADSARLRVTAGLPGEVLETNGDVAADANEVTWTVPAGERRALRAVARRPSTFARLLGRVTTPLGALVVLAVVTVIVAVAVLVRRRLSARRRAGTPPVPP